MKSLKAKILFYFILLITIPLIVSTIYIFINMHKSIEKLTFDKHMQILKIVENRADKIVIDVEYLANFIKDIESNKRITTISNIINTSNIISSIVVLDKNGLEKYFFSNTYTKIAKQKDYSDENFYKAIKDGKISSWSHVYLSKINNLPAISYTLKLDANNILVMVVNLSVLDNLANEFKTPSNESLVRIIDHDGLFLVNTDHPEFVKKQKKIYKSNLYKNYISKDFAYKQIQFLDLEKKNSIAVYGETKKLKWYVLIKETYDNIFDVFRNTLIVTIIFLSILLFVTIYFASSLSKSIIKPLDLLSNNMHNISHNKNVELMDKSDYYELDSLVDSFKLMYNKIIKKEKTILKEVNKNKKKDIKINEQSKMASMGEMIANISHQWRQPLSIISTTATSMKMQNEVGEVSSDNINKYCTLINKQSQYLSQTIEDFKNFIKNEKELKEFNLSRCIKNFENLINPTSKSHNITLFKNCNEDIVIKSYENELIQSLINIFNNSKDAYTNEEQDKLFFIDCSLKNNCVHIIIKDNAGGIPKDILHKIFEPYFTTKHQSQGTGLGLHMTYKLITEGMSGSISVKNDKYIYNDISYKGASFKISLPITI